MFGPAEPRPAYARAFLPASIHPAKVLTFPGAQLLRVAARRRALAALARSGDLGFRGSGLHPEAASLHPLRGRGAARGGPEPDGPISHADGRRAVHGAAAPLPGFHHDTFVRPSPVHCKVQVTFRLVYRELRRFGERWDVVARKRRADRDAESTSAAVERGSLRSRRRTRLTPTCPLKQNKTQTRLF